MSQSHYAFLDKNIENFFKYVFGLGLSEMYLDGIVSAHGDKCYQYKNKWEDAGIPFHHGAMLYMLTYTNKLGDYKKYDSEQWVIDHYDIYKPILIDLDQN